MSLVIRHKIITAITVILFVVVVMPVGVQAATQSECNADKNELTLGLPKWYKYLEVTPENGGGRCSPQVDDFSAVLPVGLAVCIDRVGNSYCFNVTRNIHRQQLH
jgi:hypothetical protein